MNHKKKIVYIISWKFSDSDGVTRKTIQQLTEWSKNFEILLIWLENSGSNNRIISELNFKTVFSNVKFNPLGYVKILIEIIKFKPNYIYSRYPFFHPFIYLVHFFFNSIFEINTLEKMEMKINKNVRKSLIFNLIFHIVFLFRRFFLKKAKAIFFVTRELMSHRDYENFSPRFFVPNSLHSSHFVNIDCLNNSSNINLLFIGTQGHPWHGIDKIMLIAKNTPKFIYHIVGTTGEDTNNVKFYGILNKLEISKLMSAIDICIGSLSLNVLGLTEACPLKVREYIASGFPIVLGYNDSAFLEKVPSWVYHLDINNIDIDQFITFCYNNKGVRISENEKLQYISLENIEYQRIKILRSLND